MVKLSRRVDFCHIYMYKSVFHVKKLIAESVFDDNFLAKYRTLCRMKIHVSVTSWPLASVYGTNLKDLGYSFGRPSIKKFITTFEINKTLLS